MGVCIRLLVLVLYGTALVLGSADAQETTKIKVVERTALPARQVYGSDLAPPAATHELTLTLVYFTDGIWSRNAMLAATRAALKILAQCDVRLRRAYIIRVDAPAPYHYLDTPMSRELARTLRLSTPTVYFVTDTRQEPAFDAEAIGRANSQLRPELTDTVWITRATHDVGVALAHELVHVLTDSGAHDDRAGNLMRDRTAPENTHLTETQCAQVRDVGIQNGLLRRR